jgi:hypothetical protein
MYESAAAPFPLQADGFSCHDALNFNSYIREMACEYALFEDAVNLQ